MQYLIYEQDTGRIEALREMSGQDGAGIIENLWGAAGLEFYASKPHFGAFPVGKKIDLQTVKLIADPDYVPPPVV
jgi:hypothetical protein